MPGFCAYLFSRIALLGLLAAKCPMTGYPQNQVCTQGAVKREILEHRCVFLTIFISRAIVWLKCAGYPIDSFGWLNFFQRNFLFVHKEK